MKKILILGATGTFGKRLVTALKEKDFKLTLASRNATSVYKADGKTLAVDCDVTNLSLMTNLVKGHDVVYCAVSGEQLPIVAQNLVAAMQQCHISRLLFMGAVGIYNEIPNKMDGDDNVDNNPDQIPNRKAVDIIEESLLNYTILRPGYLREGSSSDYVLTQKGETAKGYISTIPSVVNLAVKLIEDDCLFTRQSVSITKDMTYEKE